MSSESTPTGSSTTTTTTTTNAPTTADKKSIPCRFFQSNTCRNGAACAFSHVLAPAPSTNNNTTIINNNTNINNNNRAPPQQVSLKANTANATAPAAAAAAVPAAAATTTTAAGGLPIHAAPVLIVLQPGVPVFSIDVECVATGTQHNARATGQIALVDHAENAVLNLYVTPKDKVVSYLTPLTGLTKELLESKGIPLDEAMKQLRAQLPREAVLVGQNIAKDVEWLGLKEGEDFAAMIDLAALLRVWNERYHSFTYFGLAHAAKCWLGVRDDALVHGVSDPHDAVVDAQRSVRLFNLYCRLQHSPAALASMQQVMLATAVTPSFAKANPTYEGCCMGNRKTCECGAPFFN